MHDHSESIDGETLPRVVLLVEDEVIIRAVAAEALRDAGLEVVEAATADEAIRLVAAGLAPDVLFTDVRMPGVRDGLVLAGELKAALPNLLVFIASGHLDENVGTVAAQHFFRKPYEMDAVVARICAALEG